MSKKYKGKSSKKKKSKVDLIVKILTIGMVLIMLGSVILSLIVSTSAL